MEYSFDIVYEAMNNISKFVSVLIHSYRIQRFNVTRMNEN